MAKLFVVAGLAWAVLGVVSLVSMTERLRDDPGGMAAFGLALNYVLFIIPGLFVAIVAAIVLWRRRRREVRRG